MHKEIFLVEKMQSICFELEGRISSWCMLPDGTFVGEGRLDKDNPRLVRWDMKTKNILSTSPELAPRNLYLYQSYLFSLSDHLVLVFFFNDPHQLCVYEWDYKTNAMQKKNKYLFAESTGSINSVQRLRSDRFLIKFEHFVAMYDSNDQNLIYFDLVCRDPMSTDFVDLDFVNLRIWRGCHFLEEREEGLLSFVLADGRCVEGSWRELMRDYGANQNKKNKAEQNPRNYIYVRELTAKKFERNFFESIGCVNLVKILSNGGKILLTGSAKNIFCVDQTKEPAVCTEFRTDKTMEDDMIGFLELKCGLILGWCKFVYWIFIWNREGELLWSQSLPLFHDVVESNDGDLIFMGPSMFVTLQFKYNKKNLVNLCCDALAKFVLEKTSDDKTYTTRLFDTQSEILTPRQVYANHLRDYLPLNCGN